MPFMGSCKNLFLIVVLSVFWIPYSTCQVNSNATKLDSLESEFNIRFKKSKSWLLTQMRWFRYDPLLIENENADKNLRRYRFTKLYINYAHLLTEDGLDLNFDYNSITCYRWSVLGPPSEAMEIARKNNEDLCNKKSIYSDYKNFKDAFKTFYKSDYRMEHHKFAEVKALIDDFYDDKPETNKKQVLKMLRQSK